MAKTTPVTIKHIAHMTFTVTNAIPTIAFAVTTAVVMVGIAPMVVAVYGAVATAEHLGIRNC